MNKTTYQQHFVAFMDILGFKNIINSSSFDKVLSIFKSIITDNQAAVALRKAVADSDDFSCYALPEEERLLDESFRRYNHSLDLAKIYIMSDSIVVAVPYICGEALAVTVDICDIIAQQLLSLESPVLVRGAVSKGDFYIGDNRSEDNIFGSKTLNTLVFGKGLVDAYVAQEHCAIYPRVIISDDVLKEYEECTNGWNLGLPQDKDGYSYINSIERYLNAENRSWEEIEASEEYKKLMDMIDDNLGVYNDAGVRDKYIWLRNEVKRIEGMKFLEEGILSL